MAGKKRVDPIKQREKRAKIAAGIGGLLFILVCAYEVPSIMSSLNQKPAAPPASAASTTPTGTVPDTSGGALPNVAVTTTSTTAPGELANTDVPPSSDGAQLVTFSLFPTKDPFTPQGGAPATQPPDTSTAGAGTSTTTGPTSTSPTTTTPSVIPGSPSSSTTPTTTTAATPTVAISVNNVVSHVGLQGTFPSSSPVFRLMSYTPKTAQIGIVGGSYATGDQSLTLQLGRPVTLENTNDQKTYKLDLVATH